MLPIPSTPKRRAKSASKELSSSGWLSDPTVYRDVEVYRSLSADLDESATNTVKKWKFAPGTKGGEPVAVQIIVEISFHL